MRRILLRNRTPLIMNSEHFQYSVLYQTGTITLFTYCLRCWTYNRSCSIACNNSHTPFVRFQFVVCYLLATILGVVHTSKSRTSYEACVELCGILFEKCLQVECPKQVWPLPVSKKCTDIRSECLELCESFQKRKEWLRLVRRVEACNAFDRGLVCYMHWITLLRSFVS